ncbi:hypothetical protein [Salinarimonas sp.]|uniref:hypothetical protein n=1 Tax=Salinarimonas sp. TaxID=2766526 RepID=UPI00391AB710
MDGVTRATVGPGEIIIRDEEAQTQDLAALNRDLDAAQEVFRNEAAGVRFYASDSAVRAAVDAIEFVGRTLSEISSDAFRRLDNDALDQAADALARGALTDAELLAQLGACTTTRGGFNLFHLFVSPAHATIECRVETRDGQVIRFTAEDKELCLETYLAIGQRDPSTFQKIAAGLTITNIFAKPLGDMAAIMGTGPVALGEENGEALFAMDAAGRFLYRNEITGTYFFANPNDPRDMVVLDTTFELAGIFSGTSVASRVTARVYASVVNPSARQALSAPPPRGPLTGTVWDDIVPTQDVYPGSVIPRSFELGTRSGERFWIAPNATEHLVEYAQGVARNFPPEVVSLRSQQQMRSMQAAIESAVTTQPIRYNELLNVGGWELLFAPPRNPGQLPAVIHALPIR